MADRSTPTRRKQGGLAISIFCSSRVWRSPTACCHCEGNAQSWHRPAHRHRDHHHQIQRDIRGQQRREDLRLRALRLDPDRQVLFRRPVGRRTPEVFLSAGADVASTDRFNSIDVSGLYVNTGIVDLSGASMVETPTFVDAEKVLKGQCPSQAAQGETSRLTNELKGPYGGSFSEHTVVGSPGLDAQSRAVILQPIAADVFSGPAGGQDNEDAGFFLGGSGGMRSPSSPARARRSRLSPPASLLFRRGRPPGRRRHRLSRRRRRPPSSGRRPDLGWRLRSRTARLSLPPCASPITSPPASGRRPPGSKPIGGRQRPSLAPLGWIGCRARPWTPLGSVASSC